MFKRDPNLLHILTHKLYLLNTEIRTVAWSPDGACLAGGTDEDMIRIWSTSNRRVVRTLRPPGWLARLKGLFNGVSSVAWSRSGHILASGNENGVVKLWQAANGELLRSLPKSDGAVWSVALRPNDAEAAVATVGCIRIYDIAAGAFVHSLEGHQSIVWSVAYNPAGDVLASGGEDKTVRLWDATDGWQRASFSGHQRGVHVVAWSPDGTMLASGSTDSTVRLWRVADGTCVAMLRSDAIADVNAIAWSPDGRRLACGGHSGVVHVWRVPEGTLERTLRYRWGQDRVRSLAWHPDGNLLASGGRNGVGSTKIGTTLIWRVDDLALV